MRKDRPLFVDSGAWIALALSRDFAIMKRARIRIAYTFDHHFAAVGFRLVT